MLPLASALFALAALTSHPQESKGSSAQDPKSVALDAKQPPIHPAFGGLLAAPGDVDGDGVPEILIADPAAPNSMIWMVSLKKREYLYVVPGPREEAALTSQITMLGDLDRDGVPDWILAGYSSNSESMGSGHLSVLDDRPNEVWVRSGKTGKLLFTLLDEHPGERLGCCAASTEDFDGDGIPDFVLGCKRVGTADKRGPLVSIRSGKDGHEILGLGRDEVDGTVVRHLAVIRAFHSDQKPTVLVECDEHYAQRRWVWLSTVTGETLRTMQLSPSYLGRFMSAIGDHNGDGIEDVLAGSAAGACIRSGKEGRALLDLLPFAYRNTETGAASAQDDEYGSPCIVLGGAKAEPRQRFVVAATSHEVFGGALYFHDASDGRVLYRLVNKVEDDHHMGAALVNVGDVDGDGWDDLAVGYVNGFSNTDGPVYVLSGRTRERIYEVRQYYSNVHVN